MLSQIPFRKTEMSLYKTMPPGGSFVGTAIEITDFSNDLLTPVAG
jgi:hypothetical protein